MYMYGHTVTRPPCMYAHALSLSLSLSLPPSISLTSVSLSLIVSSAHPFVLALLIGLKFNISQWTISLFKV